jgi:hypothetical protein
MKLPLAPCSAIAAVCALAAALPAQSFVDLVDARYPAQPFASLFQLELGAIGAIAADEEPLRGLEDDISWDARAYYRNEAFGSRRGTLEAYAGRDGLFAALSDGKMIGDDTVAKIEFHGRPWQFYRDGFYRGDELVAAGFYEGSDYEGYLGFGREAQQGLYIEFGPYYRVHDFERSRLTAPTFTVPDGYSAYGGRLYLEQNAVQYDRRRGTPRNGYVLTLIGEREWNDSEDTFGTPLYQTQLPSAVWRARGRLEWYIAGSDRVTWEVFGNGGWHDDKDRIQNTDGSRPLGNQWADVQIRLRIEATRSITLTPFVHAQYSRVLKEDGIKATKDFFFGGGLDTYWHLGDALSLHAYYSYLDNENRPSIRIDRDVHGEHMFYVGMALTLGAQRR